jgi:hypothetical protein
MLLSISLIYIAPTVAVHYNYPYPCCGNIDCGEIVEIIILPEGKRNITIRLWNGTFRSAVFPKDFTISLPIDNKSHACISYSAEPLCLFGNDEI